MFSIINKIKKEKSYIINADIVKKNINNPDFPYLISFPRTGSHWLRMLMELYLQKPSLVRYFYIENAKEFSCFHDHDLNLKTKRKNIIYLYRNPVETIYSQLVNQKQDINNKILIKYWSTLYGLHLEKWLVSEKYSDLKTIITYEGLKNNINHEFKKICKHFNITFDETKLNLAKEQVSKKDLKNKTHFQPQVINLTEEYELNKKTFIDKNTSIIYSHIFNQNFELKKYFITKSKKVLSQKVRP